MHTVLDIVYLLCRLDNVGFGRLLRRWVAIDGIAYDTCFSIVNRVLDQMNSN